MPQFTPSFEEFDVPWDALDASTSATDLDHLWSSYANPDGALSISMAGLDGSRVSSSNYNYSQSYQLDEFDLSTFPQPPDVLQEPLYSLEATCSNPQCSQCFKPMSANTRVSLETTALERSRNTDQLFDSTQLIAAPPHLQLPSTISPTIPPTIPPTTPPTALWTIPSTMSSTIPTSDTGLGSSRIPMEPHWEAGLVYPQLFEENSYNNAYPSDNYLNHISIPPMHPHLSVAGGIPMEPHWEAGLAHPQLPEENSYNYAYLSDVNLHHTSPPPIHPHPFVAGDVAPHDHQMESSHPNHHVQQPLPLSGYYHYEEPIHLGGQMVGTNQGRGETTAILAGVLDQPYGTDPSSINNPSHDSDTAWQTITEPRAGTVALKQLDRSPASITKSHQTTATSTTTLSHYIPPASIPSYSIPPPSTPHSSTPLDIILTGAKECSYVGPDGKACKRNMAGVRNRNVARHWVTCHAMKELRHIRAKKLAMSKATIINSTARKLTAERYLGICPLESCKDKGKPGAEFARGDSLSRHLANPQQHKGSVMSRLEANRWTRANMKILGTSDEFASAYEEAVSRIWHGY